MSEDFQKPGIMQVCLSPAFGGLEMSSVKWTRLFAEQGYPSYLACLKGSKVAELARSQNLATVEFDKPTQYFSLAARSGFTEVIDKLKPTAVFSHSTKDLWHLTPILSKHPEILFYQFARMFIRGVKKTDFLHKYIYGRLTKMIALSQIQKSLLLTSLPLDDSKYVVIPNGVDTKKFSPKPTPEQLKKALGWKGKGVLIGLIGRLDIQKGHREFVEAANIIKDIHPDTHFVMVGGENSGEKNDSAKTILGMIAEHKLEDHITITGHRSDIPDVLNALDVFCMPSYEENFGNVMLEAMASGTACVGTNSGGTPEMISEGHSGILVSPKSSEALSGGLLRLIEDDSLRKHLAENARAEALEKFEMSEVFKMVERLLTDAQVGEQ